MRCEVSNSEEVFCVHYIYVNQSNVIAIENYLCHGEYDITESTIKELVKLVKDDIRDELENLNKNL